MLVIDLVVKWYKIRIFSGDIIHNCLFETASKIEIFKPEQIALILYPLKDCFKIRDTGEYRGYETDCSDTSLIYLVHSSDTVLSKGKLSIKIPVPSGFDIGNLNVIKIHEDGTTKEYSYVINNNYIEFETDSFGTFAIAEPNITTPVSYTHLSQNPKPH